MQIFTYILFGFLVVCAVSVSLSKNLLNSILIYMSYSLIMSVIWILLESPDLAITEAAVGAGITSVLFFLTLKKIHAIVKSESESDAERNAETPSESDAEKRTETKSESAAEKKAETKSESVSEKKAETKSEFAAEKKAETKSESASEKNTETQSEAGKEDARDEQEADGKGI